MLNKPVNRRFARPMKGRSLAAIDEIGLQTGYKKFFWCQKAKRPIPEN
jgi:hypothetical protein